MQTRTKDQLAQITLAHEESRLESRLRQKVARRILPYLFLLYVIAFLDRVNVSYAALGMVRDLGLSATQLGFGLGIFFIGYFILEIPSALIVEFRSARLWMARIMLVWGVVASGTGFIHTPLAFYFSRFVLGLAEAGFFPGMVIYLTHWFTEQDRAKAVAMFMVAVPVSYVIGSPISALLLRVTWWNIAGWRWVFIVEGIPAIVLGIVNLWYLQDWPKDATWLNEGERRRLQSTIQGASEGKTDRLKAIGYLKHPTVVVMSAVLFLNATGAYGFSLWLPTIISHSTNASDHWSALAAAIPYVVSAVSLVLFGWHSDLRQERRWHTAIPLFLCAIGLSLGAMFSESHVLALVAICLVGSGLYSFLPSFWACVSEVLAGGAAATATGLINAFGSLGGFAGPYLIGYWRLRTHSFKVPLVILAVMMYGAGILIVSINQRKSLVI